MENEHGVEGGGHRQVVKIERLGKGGGARFCVNLGRCGRYGRVVPGTAAIRRRRQSIGLQVESSR